MNYLDVLHKIKHHALLLKQYALRLLKGID
jgi:hypothetical protein